jgi:hypothetical protein
VGVFYLIIKFIIGFVIDGLLLCGQMGKLKKRIRPSDITINIGKDASIPECPIPGERFVLNNLLEKKTSY